MFLLLKNQKLLTFLVKKPKKKVVMFFSVLLYGITQRRKNVYSQPLLNKSFWFLELGEKVFLDSSRWDEWQKFENLFSLDFEKQNEFYYEMSMLRSFFYTEGQIWAHMARVNCPNSDFFC